MQTKNMFFELDALLDPQANFDIIKREISIGERMAAMYFVDGYIKDEIYEKMYEFFFKITKKEISEFADMGDFSRLKMPYVEVDVLYDAQQIATQVLSGLSALVIDGINGALLIDTRTYPTRSIEEPEKDRTLRGSKDGFVETLIFNTALIRRRIRDTNLRMEYMQVGSQSKADIVVSYIKGSADEKTLKALKNKLNNLPIKSISMTQQAISEMLIKTNFFNPYPKFKFTERPDYASAALMEGKILVIMDNSPAVLIVPTGFADFFRETEDYYFPPFVGTYTRILRIAVSLMTVYLSPLFLLLIEYARFIPDWFRFILPESSVGLGIFWQFIILELLIDGLKLSSLNTPSSLSSAFGIIGGLLLSDLAINAGWFNTQTVLIMAFISISTYSQPSFEMGYAMKFERMILLVLTNILGVAGLLIGMATFLVLKLCCKTLVGHKYLYPIIPFNAKQFLSIFVRLPIGNKH